MMLTQEETLRAYFEKTTRKSWGWNNFDRDEDEEYISSYVRVGWKCFKHGFEMGQEEGYDRDSKETED